jgi:DNA-binding CsgD family transcriptional regulator
VESLFATAVEEIYTAAPDPARWPKALQAIADCFGDIGAILIYGRDDGAFGVIESPQLASLIPEYARTWSQRDIRANRSRERGYFVGRDVITDRDVVTPEEMETDPFYAEFLAGNRLKYFAAAMVSPDPRIEVALSVQRGIDKPEFSEPELARLLRLGPHVERSLRLSIRLMDSELINEGFGAALARIGIGTFVLDSLGRVVFSNPHAQALLGDGIEIVDDRLVISPSTDRDDAEAVLRRMLTQDAREDGAGPKPILIHRRRSSRPLALYIMPITAAAALANQFLTQARVIILVIDPDTDAPPDPALVRDLLGLTLGEARIAALVGSGLPPQEAADKLGVSVETARTVLKRVFQKVGVSRQSELAALMTRLLLR